MRLTLRSTIIRAKKRVSRIRKKLLKDSLKMQRIRGYIEKLDPRKKELKQEILELLKDPKVQERIEKGNIRVWIKEARKRELNHPNHNRDDEKLLILGAHVMGKPLNQYSKQKAIHWINECHRVWDSESAEELIYELFKFIQHENWDSLEEGKTRVIDHFGEMWFSHDCHKKAVEYVQKLLDSIEPKTWKKIDGEMKGAILYYFGNICLRNSAENAVIYLNAVLRILENKIPLDFESDLDPTLALRETIQEYLRLVQKQELDSLENIQEIIRDLILIQPQNVFKRHKLIFGNVSRDQFCLLCERLAEVSPELVELLGQELERTVWDDAA